MTKELPFLIHYIGARNDSKLVEAEQESRGLYKAIWWDLVEMLWEQGGYLPMNPDRLAYILRYPTPEEVRAVICDFGLFDNDGQRIWNDCALEGIRHKKEVSAKNAGNRRGKGTNNDRSTDDKGTNNDRSTDEERPSPIKKERKKDIKKDISISASDAEKADIYRLFFFKNFRNPEKELQRFLDRYEGNWTRTGSTIPERDHMKLARSWKPEVTDPRFKDPDSLAWLKTFAAWLTDRGIDADAFLHAIDGLVVGRQDYYITVHMQDQQWRDRVIKAFEGGDVDVQALAAPYRGIKIGCARP